MKKILILSIALLIFIVGVSCSSAINLDVETGPKIIGSDEIIKVTGDVTDLEKLRHFFDPVHKLVKKPKTKPALQSIPIYRQGKKYSREHNMVKVRGSLARASIAEKLKKIKMTRNYTIHYGNDSGILPVNIENQGDEIYKLVNGTLVPINPDNPIPVGPFLPEPMPEPIHIVE